MNHTYGQTCEACLKEMFKRVGETYPNKKLTDQKDWYMKRSWTSTSKRNIDGLPPLSGKK